MKATANQMQSMFLDAEAKIKLGHSKTKYLPTTFQGPSSCFFRLKICWVCFVYCSIFGAIARVCNIYGINNTFVKLFLREIMNLRMISCNNNTTPPAPFGVSAQLHCTCHVIFYELRNIQEYHKCQYMHHLCYREYE